MDGPQVQVIRNPQRLGFSTNNNLVLRQGQGRYLMLLNDDTLVLKDALDILVGLMDRHPEAGAAGSLLLNPDRSFQATFAFFPSSDRSALALRQLVPPGAAQAARPFEVDSVCGAAMVVRRAVIDSVGVLDTAFDPIYSEEVDWCYRIKQAGWKVFAVPQSQIVHYGSQTMNKAVPRKYELLWAHKLVYFRKHKGNLYLRISTASFLVCLPPSNWLGGPSLVSCAQRIRTALTSGTCILIFSSKSLAFELDKYLSCAQPT